MSRSKNIITNSSKDIMRKRGRALWSSVPNEHIATIGNYTISIYLDKYGQYRAWSATIGVPRDAIDIAIFWAKNCQKLMSLQEYLSISLNPSDYI